MVSLVLLAAVLKIDGEPGWDPNKRVWETQAREPGTVVSARQPPITERGLYLFEFSGMRYDCANISVS
jgi:hypothetical protein